MMHVREKNSERLVVGASRNEEFVGLLLSALGLFGLSAIVIGYLEQDVGLAIPMADLPAVAECLLAFGLAGVFMVFSQRRFVFLADQKVVVFRHGFAKQKIWRYDQLGSVELEKRTGGDQAAAFLLLQDGRRETLSRGRPYEVKTLADQVAEYVGISVKPFIVVAPTRKAPTATGTTSPGADHTTGGSPEGGT